MPSDMGSFGAGRYFQAHGEPGSMCDRAGGAAQMELNAMRHRDEERNKKEDDWVDVFNFGDSFSETKYGCINGWVKREGVIKDIQNLLHTKKLTVTVYRPKDKTHRSSLYFKPMNLRDKGDKEEQLNLEEIGEATYEDGVIESVKTF